MRGRGSGDGGGGWCEGEDGRGGVVKSCGAEGRRSGREAVGGGLGWCKIGFGDGELWRGSVAFWEGGGGE